MTALRILLVGILACLAPAGHPFAALAQERTWVGPYSRGDGTSVRGHYRGGGNSGESVQISGGVSGTITGPGRRPQVSGYLQQIGGFYRKDGTYVQAHLRTVADGDLTNNLSYVDGTTGGVISIRSALKIAGFEDSDIASIPGLPLDSVVSPGYLATFSSLVQPKSVDEQGTRIQLAAEMLVSGTALDWRRHGLEELVIFQKRARKAEEVRRLGIDVDWRQVTFSQLLDLECIASSVRDLKAAGVTVDPSTVTCQQVQVLAHKVALASRIRALGKEVDWRKLSVEDLVDIEEKLLRKKGER